MTKFAVIAFASCMTALWIWRLSRQYTVKGVLWYLTAFAAVGLLPLTTAHTTWPSSAERVRFEGRCIRYRVAGTKSDRHYELQIVTDSGLLAMQSGMFRVPDLSGAKVYGVYLKKQPVKCIALAIEDGPFAGWHDELDARWDGGWILVPVQLLIFFVCLLMGSTNSRPAEARAHRIRR